jgi:outer membrane protein assembly factor BamB
MGGSTYFGSADGNFYCLDAINGIKVWDFEALSIDSSPAISDEKVYFGSDDKKIYCLDGITGTKIWDYQTGHRIYSSPAITNGKVYIGSLDKKLYCLDAKTGIKMWEFISGQPIYSSPTISNGKVYCGLNDGKFYCLDAISGAKVWEYVAENQILFTPSINNGKVYFASGYQLNCLDATTGTKVWDYPSDRPIGTSLTISNNNIYFGSSDGCFYCLEENTDDTSTDTKPPVITLLEPTEQTISMARPGSFTIKYTAKDKDGIISTSVNGLLSTFTEDLQYPMGYYYSPVQLLKGTNTFVVRATDASSARNTTELTLTIIIENNVENAVIDIPKPTLEENAEYSSWYLAALEGGKPIDFMDIQFELPKLRIKQLGAEITKFVVTTKPGYPDIPVYALKINIPYGQEYVSYDLDYEEDNIALNGSLITPTKKQLPLPVGGKPYVLPDNEEYGLKSVNPKPIALSKPNTISRTGESAISGGNPYRWPPELYSKKTNELVIYIKPAYYNKPPLDKKNDNSVQFMKNISIKIRVTP